MQSALKAWPVLVVAAGLGFLAARGFMLPYVIEEEHKEAFLAEGPAAAISVEVFNGSIKITLSKGKEVHARLVKRAEGADKMEAEKALEKIQVRLEKLDGNRFVFTGKLSEKMTFGNHGVYAELEVPADADLKLVTSNASVSVTEIQGEIVVDTANGGVTVKGNQKPVKVKTSNGGVTIQEGRGKLDVQTTNASVKIFAQQAAAQVKTSNGGITFHGTLDEGGTHTLTTSNSKIEVKLPPDSQFRLDAATSNSKITSDFDGLKELIKKNRRATRVEGNAGSHPRYTLKLQTSNGGIAIKHGSPIMDGE